MPKSPDLGCPPDLREWDPIRRELTVATSVPIRNNDTYLCLYPWVGSIYGHATSENRKNPYGPFVQTIFRAKAKNEEAAEKLYARCKPDIKIDDNEISVYDVNSRQEVSPSRKLFFPIAARAQNYAFFDGLKPLRLLSPISLEIALQVPPDYPLPCDLMTYAGNIRMNGITYAEGKLQTTYGHITMANTRGDVKTHVTEGYQEIDSHKGNVDSITNFGTTFARSVTGNMVSIVDRGYFFGENIAFEGIGNKVIVRHGNMKVHTKVDAEISAVLRTKNGTILIDDTLDVDPGEEDEDHLRAYRGIPFSGNEVQLLADYGDIFMS